MKLLIILLLSSILYGDAKEDLFNLYKAKKYKQACDIGLKKFKYYKDDEEYISLYAFSCLKSDQIDRLATPIAKLKFSKEARVNASYFSILLMQKKLLYHAMVDDYDLKEFNFPTTDHILSKAFDHYSQLGKHEKKEFYLFDDEKNKKLTYKLYLQKDTRLDKIVIEEIYNSKIIKRHMYW